jgi:hypothetical protein
LNHYTRTDDYSASDCVMPFGKFKGWRLSEIDNDSYIAWLYNLPDLREPLASAVAAEYQRRHSQEAEEAYEPWRRQARREHNRPEPGKPPGHTRELVEIGFRAMAKVHHPDIAGGSNDRMREVIAARSWLLQQVAAAEMVVQ